jgi:hypothetical protein
LRFYAKQKTCCINENVKISWSLVMKKILYLTMVTISSLGALPQEAIDTLLALHIAETRLPAPSNKADHIACNQLIDYALCFAQSHITSQNITYETLPETIKAKIADTCNKICASLAHHLERGQQTAIHKTRIQTLIKEALGLIIKEVPTLIPKNDIPKKINDYTNQFFQDHELSMSDIPASMKDEFDSRKTDLQTKLNQLMKRNNQDYVTLPALQSAIQTAFDAFIDRAQHALIWQWFSSQVPHFKNRTIDRATSSFEIDYSDYPRVKKL